MVTPQAVILLGATGYFLAWLAHDNGRFGIGEWRTPPPLLRRLLRFRDGPIRAASVAFEFWAVGMLVTGTVTAIGSFDKALEAQLLASSLYGVIIVGFVWTGLALAVWARRRR